MSALAEELVADDPVVGGLEHRHPREIDGEPVADDPALAEAEALGGEHRDAIEVVLRRGNPPHRISPRPADQDPVPELPDLAVLDHEPGASAGVIDAGVADLLFPAVGDELVVAVDRVPVEVEGDAVGTDHDPVAWAVDQVAVKLRVGLDLVAAAQLAGGRLTGARRENARKGEHQDHLGNAAHGVMPPSHRPVALSDRCMLLTGDPTSGVLKTQMSRSASFRTFSAILVR